MKVRRVLHAKRYVYGKTKEVSDHVNSAGHKFGMRGGETVPVGAYLITNEDGLIEVCREEDFKKNFKIED